MSFLGTKAALLCDGALAVLRRDMGEIPWPGRIDLPGGGRDGDESPEACVLREIREEVGLALAPGRLVWARSYPREDGRADWFFAGVITGVEAAALRLGDEGQACWMMPVPAYLESAEAIPHQQARLRDYLAEA